MVAIAGHKGTMGLCFGQNLAISAPAISPKAVLKTIAVFATLTLFSLPALAQPATCDPQYWEAMKSRAWMEAQREISQNQNLIYKPDSVLEYTCFDKFVGSVADVIHNKQALFSETKRWGTEPPGNMLTSLSTLVLKSLNTYVTTNYAHPSLGGRGKEDYKFDGDIGSKAIYSCEEMYKIWELAKCTNFVSIPEQDDFFLLSVYSGGFDPRGLPTQSGHACTADTTRWSENTRRANNDDKAYQEETFEMYENFFDVSACSAPPIPTGIKVTRPGVDTYDEYICANPGCAHDRKGACVQVAPRDTKTTAPPSTGR